MTSMTSIFSHLSTTVSGWSNAYFGQTRSRSKLNVIAGYDQSNNLYEASVTGWCPTGTAHFKGAPSVTVTSQTMRASVRLDRDARYALILVGLARGGDARHVFVLGLARGGDAVNGHADKDLPHLTRAVQWARTATTTVGTEVGEALEVARADAGGGSRGEQREAVVDRLVEDADCSNIEGVDDLARALVGITLGGAKTGRGTCFRCGGVAALQARERRTTCNCGCLENEMHGVAVQNAKDWGEGRGNVPEASGSPTSPEPKPSMPTRKHFLIYEVAVEKQATNCVEDALKGPRRDTERGRNRREGDEEGEAEAEAEAEAEIHKAEGEHGRAMREDGRQKAETKGVKADERAEAEGGGEGKRRRFLDGGQKVAKITKSARLAHRVTQIDTDTLIDHICEEAERIKNRCRRMEVETEAANKKRVKEDRSTRRAPTETEEPPKQSLDEGTLSATRPKDWTLMRTSEGKIHPEKICSGLILTKARECTASHGPQPGSIIKDDFYFRESALLEGEQNNLPLTKRVTADGAHPACGDSDVSEGPRGLEHALSSTAVDSEAAGPHTVETRGRANWLAQGNVTEPWPPSQKPRRP
ncbi:hypothetical protein BC826DRAFT_1155469 [Russula brevipes]|nr:hypothetical protein BC826DRAFT_1155469 [Russula brevipes]